MLVLTRKINETIIIDSEIRITVVGIRGSQVRLGIQAPDQVGIFREELCLLMQAEAAGPSPEDADDAPRALRFDAPVTRSHCPE